MEKDNIEQLLTDTFDDYTVPEFKNSWPGIKSEVFRKQFFKFNIYQFNAYYGIVVVATMLTAGILFFSPSEPEKAHPVPTEMEDLMEVPAVEDTISTEGHLEQVPEINEMDNHGDEPEGIVPMSDNSAVPERAVVPHREVEVINDLKSDTLSFHESKEVNVDGDVAIGGLDKDTLIKVLEDDSSKMEGLIPLEPIVIQKELDALIKNTSETERKKVIVVEPPVVKRDTVVKVIRERRRR